VPDTGIPLIPKGWTQPIFVEVCIPYGQIAGNYTGSIEITSTVSGAATAASNGTSADPTSQAETPVFTVPVKLEVWDIDLPKLNDTGAFNTARDFSGRFCLPFFFFFFFFFSLFFLAKFGTP
jgi:hypothetical protein